MTMIKAMIVALMHTMSITRICEIKIKQNKSKCNKNKNKNIPE